jgi:hypothetical protein
MEHLVEVISEQANDFIKKNGGNREGITQAVEYLAFLSMNDFVKASDLKCDEDRLKELNRSAKDMGLLNENFVASALIKEHLHKFFTEGEGKSQFGEIYHEVKNHDIYQKALQFIEEASSAATYSDAYQYLAALAIKGEVKVSDLDNHLEEVKLSSLGSFNLYFKKLNTIAAELGLIRGTAYFSINKRVVASEETREALNKFMMEKGSPSYLHNILPDYYHTVKERIVKKHPDMDFRTKDWKPVDDRTESVAQIKRYLAEKIEDAFPGNRPVVKYGSHRERDSWSKELVFNVVLPNKDKVDDSIRELQKVFPDMEGDSGVFIYKNENDNGFSVSGKPWHLSAMIKKKDPQGWNNLIYGVGVSLG